MSNELTTTNAANFALAPLTEDTMSVIREELDGLGQIPFDIIKIPSGGGIAFEVPGDDSENPDMAKEVVGVIVDHHPMNSWWADEYSGGNAPPDCASIDGKTGIFAGTGECLDCATCQRNQFGSDGNGKACKNLHRLYVLREGEPLPVIFNIPPTSLKAFKDYLAKRIVLKGKRAFQVVTKITLKKAQNAGGIAYSQAVFTKVGDLTQEQVDAIKPTVAAVKEMARKMPVNDQPIGAEVEFHECDSDEQLPFD